jgi:hypothetical protein
MCAACSVVSSVDSRRLRFDDDDDDDDDDEESVTEDEEKTAGAAVEVPAFGRGLARRGKFVLKKIHFGRESRVLAVSFWVVMASS